MSGQQGRDGGHRRYPVHLRLEGRTILVVGAGRVAARRLERLVDSGAHVVVVAPEAAPTIEELAAAGRIELRRRPFEPSDVRGAWLVHTATDDPAVNEAVVAAVRALSPEGEGVPSLVSAADGAWRDGDFVIPATFDHGTSTVSVGSGGTDYRKSRDIKALLRRQMEAVRGAELVVVGADQRCLDLESLERVCREAGDERRLRATLAALRPVDEFFVLNTCNRFECYMIAGANPIVQELVVHGMRLHMIPEEQRYIHRGRDAFVHLSLVLAGAYAELFGETAIVAQVREALDRARTAGTAGPPLTRYVDEALNVSRRVRMAVMTGLERREAEDLCAARLAAGRPALEDEAILVVGTGAVGRAVMGRIAGRSRKIYWAFFRRPPSLAGLPEDRIEVIGVDRVPDVLPACDVIVVASGAKTPVVRLEHAPLLCNRRCLLMDLSVPRGVDVGLGQLEGIELVHLQELVNNARPSDVPALVKLSEESARLESYRYLKDDTVFP